MAGCISLRCRVALDATREAARSHSTAGPATVRATARCPLRIRVFRRRARDPRSSAPTPYHQRIASQSREPGIGPPVHYAVMPAHGFGGPDRPKSFAGAGWWNSESVDTRRRSIGDQRGVTFTRSFVRTVSIGATRAKCVCVKQCQRRSVPKPMYETVLPRWRTSHLESKFGTL